MLLKTEKGKHTEHTFTENIFYYSAPCMGTLFKSNRKDSSLTARIHQQNKTSKFLHWKFKSNLQTSGRPDSYTGLLLKLGFSRLEKSLVRTGFPASSVGSGADYHIARWTPDSCPWSAKWRKTIRLSLQRRFTPRGRDVITHRFLILTGQLSRGRAAISSSATSWRSFGKMVFFLSELIRSLSSAYS